MIGPKKSRKSQDLFLCMKKRNTKRGRQSGYASSELRRKGQCKGGASLALPLRGGQSTAGWVERAVRRKAELTVRTLRGTRRGRLVERAPACRDARDCARRVGNDTVTASFPLLLYIILFFFIKVGNLVSGCHWTGGRGPVAHGGSRDKGPRRSRGENPNLPLLRSPSSGA